MVTSLKQDNNESILSFMKVLFLPLNLCRNLAEHSMKWVTCIGLKRFSTFFGWSICKRSKLTVHLREAFTGVQGVGPLAHGGCKGAVPSCLRKFVFDELNMHNFRSFLILIYKNNDFWWSQGGSPTFHKKMCAWKNHKCTISVPFPSKFIRVYDFGGCK